MPGIRDHLHPAPRRGEGRGEGRREQGTYQEPGVLDDAQLLGPLAQPLLAPEEGTDAGVAHQLDAGLRRGPLVRGRLALAALFLIVGLVGAAHGLSVLCKGRPRCHSPAGQGMLLNRLCSFGRAGSGQRAGTAPWAPDQPPHPAPCPGTSPSPPTAGPGRLSGPVTAEQSVLDAASGHRHR